MAEVLKGYRDIVRGKARARFLSAPLEDRLRKAEALASPCNLCERRCGADRKGGKAGYCGVLESRVSSEFLHYGEEPELTPSHTIFFAGCTFKCVFCQNWDISQSPESGRIVEPDTLAGIIRDRSGINVNWVGGDPTSNLPFILNVMNALKELDVNVAQVWNSNMYLSRESMDILDGVIDVYLGDLKYGNDRCAKRLSGVERYWDITTRNHKMAAEQCEVLVRHLLMPGHVDCCTKPVLDWLAGDLPNEKLRVNIMDQYHPDYKVLEDGRMYPELTKRLTKNDLLGAFEYGKKLGLDLV